MKIGVLSDIHSNQYALKAVIDVLQQRKTEKLIILGDIFGYYPWACETYELLMPFLGSAVVIKGNHDQLLLDSSLPDPLPSYWDAAVQNRNSLADKYPFALQWLNTLGFEMKTEVNGKEIQIVHGTPEDPAEGRFYPDDTKTYNWFPRDGKILFLGHTHYPLDREMPDGSRVINPGSVGQPRDGNPMPSWGMLNTQDFSFELVRTTYDNKKAMEELENLNWEKRAIGALNKLNRGSLKL